MKKDHLYVTKPLLLAIFCVVFVVEGYALKKVFVYNFPFEANNDLLARALNKFGEVKDVFNG